MPRKLHRGLSSARTRLAWMLVTPTLLALAVVGLYPLLYTFFLSLTNADRDPTFETHFVGLANFAELFSEKAFLESILNTSVFTISSVGLELLIGLAFALIVHSEFKARGIMRAAILLPWALPTVVAARMWGLILDQYGVVNDLLVYKTGILDQAPVWTFDRGLAMASVVAVDVWKTTPFVALLLLAGLQLIPRNLYEAADVDGASRFQQFFTITLPLLKPAILVALIFRTLDALRVFDVIWVLTRGESGTESLATYNYQALMMTPRLGYGSAVSIAIFAIIFVWVLVYMSLLRPAVDA